MATVFQRTETIGRADGNGTFTVSWWRTTGNDISIMRNQNSINNWPAATAVNGSFFPTGTPVVNSFHINNGSTILPATTSGHGRTDGSENFNQIETRATPFDFLMDPINRSTNGLVAFGTGGHFPITNRLNGRVLNVSDIRWGIGGLDLDMANASFNTRATFNAGFRWRNIHPGSPLTTTPRTAIGYLGGNATNTNYIVAVFSSCQPFDVRNWLRVRGVSTFGLMLDGGGSTQARNNGTTVQTSLDNRTVPTIIAMR